MNAQRVSLKIHPAAATGIIVLCLFILGFFLWPIRGVAGQIFFLGIVFLLFRYSPPMMRWLMGISLAHRLVFGALLTAVVVGHFTIDNRRYFPFVTWEIFPRVREENPVTCRELLAVTRQGKKVRLLAEQLFPSIVQFNLPDDNSPPMRDLVGALVREYNRLHPDDQAKSVDLLRVAVPLRSTQGAPSCEFLKRFDLSSDPSN